MAEKETKSCSGCIHFDICYKIEHFGRNLEDTSPCEQFISKDVEPVKHGHWIYKPYVKMFRNRIPVFQCSNCGIIFCDLINNYEEIYLLCPHCGAKMDGGEEND